MAAGPFSAQVQSGSMFNEEQPNRSVFLLLRILKAIKCFHLTMQCSVFCDPPKQRKKLLPSTRPKLFYQARLVLTLDVASAIEDCCPLGR